MKQVFFILAIATCLGNSALASGGSIYLKDRRPTEDFFPGKDDYPSIQELEFRIGENCERTILERLQQDGRKVNKVEKAAAYYDDTARKKLPNHKSYAVIRYDVTLTGEVDPTYATAYIPFSEMNVPRVHGVYQLEYCDQDSKLVKKVTFISR